MTKAYLEYRGTVDQLCVGSLRFEKICLRHLLVWADENSFRDAPKIRPTLPEYLLDARLDGEDETLTRDYVKRILAAARRFFEWLSDEQQEYRTIKRTWIRTLQAKRMPVEPVRAEAVSFEEILAIAQAPVNNLKEERIRAAAVFWFLSGIRIGAFVTLPLRAVDLAKREVYQYPSWGVHTKNGKHATTYLLPITELLVVVEAWDAKVREVLPYDSYWFAHLSPRTGDIDPRCADIGQHRHNLARRNLQEWLERVGLPYHSPHKFRHGFVQYGLDHSRDEADRKAISLNVMHENMQITDAVYSRLKGEKIKSRLDGMVSNDSGESEIEEMRRLIARFEQRLDQIQA